MTIIRFLLSYSLLFLLVALLAAAWIYRDRLEPELGAAWSRLETRLEGKTPGDATTGQKTPGEGAAAAHLETAGEMSPPVAPVTEGPAVAAASQNAAPSAMPESGHEMAPMQTPAPALDTEAETAAAGTETPPAAEPAPIPAVPEAAPLTEPAPGTSTEVAGETPTESTSQTTMLSAGTSQAASAPAAEPATASTPDTSTAAVSEAAPTAPGPTASETAQTAEKPAIPAKSTGPSEEAILLDRARRAYWAGDLPAAVAAYEALLDRDPAEADAWGELGNVYYAMGRWQEAGEAYYEAARRLIARGDTRQLGYLLRIIDSLAPEKAARLRSQFEAAPGGS